MSERRPEPAQAPRREQTASEASRILLIHHALNPPGIKCVRGPTRCLRDLLTHIDRSRFELVVLCNEPVISEIAATGVTVHRAPDWTESRGRFSLWWMREIRRLVRQHRVRLIHVDEYMQTATVVPVARTLRVPLLTQLHRVPTEDERRWALLHQADLVVGASRACLDGLLGDGFPRERTAVIYNAVDPERLARGDARGLRAALGIGPDDVVVALVAYFVPWKAIDVALRAFAALREIRRDCHFVLCGDGQDRGSLEAYTQTLGIQPWTHFLGDRSDVGAVLRDACDILLSTSRAESFNLTLAEAGVFGLPAVATDIPAHREVLGDAGWLVPCDDVGAFTRAMAALADDPRLRHRSGKRLQQRVETTFLIPQHARAFQEAYARLLGKPSATYGWARATTWPPLYNAWIRKQLASGVARVTRRSGQSRAAPG